jgi:excinuclease UvrABC nuclease subunit
MEKIFSIDTIISAAKPIRDQWKAGIYFLIKANQIVYIGKAKCLAKRAYSHCKDKEFDSIAMICTRTEKEAIILEAYYINMYLPILNKTIENMKGISIEEVKRALDRSKLIT